MFFHFFKIVQMVPNRAKYYIQFLVAGRTNNGYASLNERKKSFVKFIMVTFTINKCHYSTEVKTEESSLLVSHDGADSHIQFFSCLYFEYAKQCY